MPSFENKIIFNWIITLTLIFIMLISVVFFYKYDNLLLVYGQVSDNYVDIYLTDKEISELKDTLKYEEKIIKYEILEVDTNYVLFEDKLKRNVKISFPYDKSKYILEIYFNLGKTTIWQKIYEKFMKG